MSNRTTKNNNTGALQLVSQILTTIKREIESNTVKAGNLTPKFRQWKDIRTENPNGNLDLK